jgi:hypothetical protein
MRYLQPGQFVQPYGFAVPKSVARKPHSAKINLRRRFFKRLIGNEYRSLMPAGSITAGLSKPSNSAQRLIELRPEPQMIANAVIQPASLFDRRS